MNNLKKLLAVIVTVAMLVTVMLPVFAEGESFTYTAEAQKLNDLGLYKGISTTTFDPDLGTALNRETGVVMLLRIFGLEAQAEAITDADATLAKFTDAATISSWAKNAVAYAVTNGLVLGLPDGTFGPKAPLNGKAYCTLILRQLGYTPNYDSAPTELADKGGLTADEATKFVGKELVKDDLVGISFGTLSATDKDGKKVIENLVAAKVVDETAAVDVGLLTPAATPTPEPVAAVLDVDSAAALTSKAIEVSLGTAATAADVAAATFKVADAAAKEVAVTKAELAAYDADSKTVLVTLEANTTAGTLYTLTCGTQSVKFGGKAPESTKPELDEVKSNDYNEVKVTFSEPIVLEGATITIAEKYGSKASLAISNMKYDGNDTIILTTADQKGSTLYGITVESIVDFSGNKMDKDDDNTFVGTKKDADDLAIDAVSADDYNHVIVEFHTKIDTATISAGTFTVAESSGSKTSVPVASVAQLTTDQLDDSYNYSDDDNDTLTDDEKDEIVAKAVMLTLDGSMKKSTLYKATVSGGIKTLYGKALSTDSSDTEKTFVGKSKPTSALEFADTAVTVDSNTQITVGFAEKVDKALVETVANYAIAESYGSKTALTITKAEIDGTKKVKLTVASMKNILYKLTVTGVKDIYGNAIKTSDDDNVATFAGKKVAAKIDSIESITRLEDDDTTIRVEFDQNVGSNATDVSLYTIDNDIGYPEKAELVDDDAVENYKAKVDLTIPKTVQGKVYKLTVKGLLNSDGVAMASDDSIDKTFTGQGSSATKPEIVAVTAIDKQTLQIYFDRVADDGTIKGASRIWNDDHLLHDVFSLNTDDTDAANIADIADSTNFVWQDPTDKNILVVRFNAAKFTKDDSDASGYTFELIGSDSRVDDEDDVNVVEFGYNDDDPANPELTDVIADNSETLRVFFSEPVVVDETPDQIMIYSDVDGTTQIKDADGVHNITVTNAYKVTDTEWKLKLSEPLLKDNDEVPSNKAVYLYIASNADDITDKSGFLTLEPNDDENFTSVEFGINSDAADEDKITDVNVQMLDKRTIVVYYPEQMNETAVTNTANYALVSDADGTATDADSIALAPGISEYDDEEFKVTMFLDGDIGTLTADDDTLDKYYLAISSAITNETGTNEIDADKTSIDGGFANGLVVEFADSDDDAPKPTVSAATVSDDEMSLDIKMDSKVAFVEDVNNDGDITDVGDFAVVDNDAITFNKEGTLTPAEVLRAFTMTAQFDDEDEADAVEDEDIAYGKINEDHDTVTVYFVKALEEDSSGTVGTKKATANAFENKQGIGPDVTDDDGSEVSFGVAGSLFGDNSAPTLLSVVGMENGAGADTVVLTFDEGVTSAKTGAWAIFKADGTTVTITADAVTGSGSNKLTITCPAAGDANITADNTALYVTYDSTSANADVKDAANNPLATIEAPEAPAYTINYATEKTVEVIPDTVEYATNNTYTANRADGAGVVVNLTPGTDLYFRVKAAGVVAPGATQPLDVAARPAAPAGHALSQATTAGTKLSAVANTQEYRVTNADGSTVKVAWTTGAGAAIDNIAVVATDKVEIRTKATAGAFASDVESIAVGAGDIK